MEFGTRKAMAWLTARSDPRTETMSFGEVPTAGPFELGPCGWQGSIRRGKGRQDVLVSPSRLMRVGGGFHEGQLECGIWCFEDDRAAAARLLNDMVRSCLEARMETLRKLLDSVPAPEGTPVPPQPGP